MTFRPATGAAGASMAAESSSRDAAPGTLRRGPAAAGAGEAVRGSRPPVKLPPGRARAKLPPRNGESPSDSGPPPSGHPGRSNHSLGCLRLPAERGSGRQAWRAEGAPLTCTGISTRGEMERYADRLDNAAGMTDAAKKPQSGQVTTSARSSANCQGEADNLRRGLFVPEPTRDAMYHRTYSAWPAMHRP